MKIVTLTLNPAFDLHCHIPTFAPYHENIAEITAMDAGGKGVNISKALTKNGVENLAVVVVGKENGTEFCRALEKDGLNVAAIETTGRIRENITLHEDKADETRISFHGFSCDKNILDEVQKRIGATDGNTVVTFTGSIPKGITAQDVAAMLRTVRQTGAKIVIDSRSFSLADLVEFKPWLIKPNKDEAEAYTGKTIGSPEDAGRIAKTLAAQGVENVVVSLGGDGAVLATGERVWYAKTPKIKVASTIGAGDSLIAGFLDGKNAGYDAENTLKKAVAYGSAACKQSGTRPPLPEDIAAIEREVEIVPLNV